ncbi:DinB family protein [Balneolaceae bacterium YR4-1]|uniref:DinB family protein n=1 Tax=Halalkalibaculum roseum TaxID=2709311 RepID=A0A6M1SLB6_9BACT|nr:DinB family protein [Halalkalibaculum roseum]NGP76121.1 DinB family protein [Halalkalibaculum roseum]
MKTLLTLILSSLLFLSISLPDSTAQSSETDHNFREQFIAHFQYASRVLDLAKAMPADTYSWRPGEGVMSVEEVYTHIARYNYLYAATSLDIPAPDDIDMENMESISGKENVVEVLEASIDHLMEAVKQMPNAKLNEETELYGRTVNGRGVLMQHITHMSEHVGQSIAYARMNGIVPPWSR